MRKKKKADKKNTADFEEGIHPGACTDKYDINNESLDFVDSSYDVYIEDWDEQGEPANHASPPAPDPAVPNRAHTAI